MCENRRTEQEIKIGFSQVKEENELKYIVISYPIFES